MGRGKIEIKKIENSTNRQVTYSKRRSGIIKKVQELSVLCDAQVSLIMVSGSGTRRIHEYTTPTTTTKHIIDQYQKTAGVDLWSSHFQEMQENLRRLREVNNTMRKEIRQRTGEDLNELDIKQLCGLQENMMAAVSAIRERKYHVIKTQTNTYRKKVTSLEHNHGKLLYDLEAKFEEPKYEMMMVENGGGGGYTTTTTCGGGAYVEGGGAFVDGDGVSNMYGFALQQRHPDIQNFRLA